MPPGFVPAPPYTSPEPSLSRKPISEVCRDRHSASKSSCRAGGAALEGPAHSGPGHGEQFGQIGDGIVAGGVHAPQFGLLFGRAWVGGLGVCPWLAAAANACGRDRRCSALLPLAGRIAGAWRPSRSSEPAHARGEVRYRDIRHRRGSSPGSNAGSLQARPGRRGAVMGRRTRPARPRRTPGYRRSPQGRHGPARPQF
jgi:hypothetical protein